MPIKMHKLLLALWCMSVAACGTNSDYDTYKSVGVKGWAKDDLVNFQFQINDTLSKKDLFINIRNTEEFEFSNLFLIAEMQYPSGFHTVDTLEYKMTDAFGYWLGSGYTDVKENKLFYKENFSFSEMGNYEVNIQHAMRKRNEVAGIQTLTGIADVGLRIERKEN